MSTAGTALPASLRVGDSPARRKVLRPCPTSRHQHPRPRRFTHPQALHTRPLQAPQERRQTGGVLPAIGEGASPKPPLLRAFWRRRWKMPTFLLRLLHSPGQSTYGPKNSCPRSSEILRAASGTHSVRPLSGWRPQRQLRCGATRAKRGAGGRLPAFPFNGNNALSASLQ